ncbi:MAG: hypothetical protein AAFX94_19670, partial [Myxococcota bacterium]
ESLSGEVGNVENATALAIMMKLRGMEIGDGGNLDSVDGFAVNATNMAVVTDFGGVPPAVSSDDLSGGFLTPDAMSTHFDWFHQNDALEAGALMWAEMITMAESAMREMSDWKEVKNAMQKSKAESKKNEIKTAEERIDAERDAAATAFVWSVAGTALSFGLGNWGGEVGQALATAKVGDLVTQFGTMTSKISGPQAEADEKEIEAMRHQLVQEQLEQGIETAKSAYDEARELFRLALKILDEHGQRATQINAGFTRT